MINGFLNLLEALAALTVGGVIGLAFGKMQDLARQRYVALQHAGKLRSEWSVVTGSSRRIALLLGALVLIQIVCPLLFRNGIQWWVSSGVLAAYGWALYRQFRHRQSGQ